MMIYISWEKKEHIFFSHFSYHLKCLKGKMLKSPNESKYFFSCSYHCGLFRMEFISRVSYDRVASSGLPSCRLRYKDNFPSWQASRTAHYPQLASSPPIPDSQNCYSKLVAHLLDLTHRMFCS